MHSFGINYKKITPIASKFVERFCTKVLKENVRKPIKAYNQKQNSSIKF